MREKKLYGFVMIDESGKKIQAFGRCFAKNLDKYIRYAIHNEWIFIINSIYISKKLTEYFGKAEYKQQ